MVFKACIQPDKENQVPVDPDVCYSEYKENMDLIKSEIEDKISEIVAQI